MEIPLKPVEKKKSRNMFGQDHNKGFRVAFIFFIKSGLINTYTSLGRVYRKVYSYS